MENLLPLLCECGAEHPQPAVPSLWAKEGDSSAATCGGFLDTTLVGSKLQRSCLPAWPPQHPTPVLFLGHAIQETSAGAPLFLSCPVRGAEEGRLLGQGSPATSTLLTAW